MLKVTHCLNMRIDDDSYIHSDVDLFRLFHETKADYGYFKFSYDPFFVSFGYNDLVRDYIKENNLTHHIPNYVNIKEGHSPVFYNNFEMVKISHFKRKDVREFNERVKQSGGIFEYRWGDAISRFFQITLFTDKVKCFTDGFEYSHQGRGLRKESCLGPNNNVINDKN